MARRSTISQLDASIQAEVARLVREGWTIDGILAELAKLGASVSRSAMGRHVQRARKSMETYAQGQEVAKVWLDKLSSEPNGDVARLLPEMLRALAFSTIERLSDEPDDVKPMDVMLLGKALKDLSGTTKDAFAIDKARAEARAAARRELLAEQSAAIDKMSASGVTDKTKMAIREALGIA